MTVTENGLNGAGRHRTASNGTARPRRGHEALLAALAGGMTQVEAGQRAGLGKRTVVRRVAEPGFREELLAARAALFEDGLAMLARGYAASAAVLLALLQPSNPPGVRRAAARDVLELGLKIRQATELEERVAALEQQALPGPRASSWR